MRVRQGVRRNSSPRLSRAVAAIRRRGAIVLVSAVVAPAVALFVSVVAEKRFESEASVLVVTKGDREDAADRVADALQLADADALPRRVEFLLGGRVGRNDVASSVEASARSGSNLITITATMEDPRFARAVANLFAEQLVRFERESGALGKSGLKVVEEARASSDPVSPKPVRNTLIGLVAGLGLGVALALLVEALDRRVARPVELEEALGVPLLGRIPGSPALALGEALRELPAPELEAFQMIRTSLRHLETDRETKSVLLTSVAPRDGKSTVAFGVAVAAAAAGGRALVIEADMRQPSLASVAGQPDDRGGLSTVLEGKAGLSEAVATVPVAAGPERSPAQVDVLIAGPIPPNPTRLIESDRSRELLAEARSAYDLVLIDTPPATIVADAIPLVPHVDAVVVVAGLRRDERGALEELRRRLAHLDAPLVGVIANFAERPDESYYGYVHAHEAALAEREQEPPQPPPRVEARPPEPPAAVGVPPEIRQGTVDGPVDLNQATFEQLRALDLSLTQAKRILAYRQRKGGFSSVSEIDELPGFPDKVRERLKRQVKVGRRSRRGSRRR